MKNIALATALAASLAACGGSTPEQDQEMKEIAWNRKSENTVRAKLRDPSSAEFSAVRFSDKSGTPMTCGFVNSKNALGGYAGLQRFVAAGDQMAFLEEEVSDFDNVWNRYC